jgi:hypothetical protein
VAIRASEIAALSEDDCRDLTGKIRQGKFLQAADHHEEDSPKK